jgi:hypothetical protein
MKLSIINVLPIRRCPTRRKRWRGVNIKQRIWPKKVKESRMYFLLPRFMIKNSCRSVITNEN